MGRFFLLLFNWSPLVHPVQSWQIINQSRPKRNINSIQEKEGEESQVTSFLSKQNPSQEKQFKRKEEGKDEEKELHEKKGNLTGWWFNPSKAQQGRHPVCQVHETPGFRVCVKMIHLPNGFRICVKIMHQPLGFRVCARMMHQPHGFRICVKMIHLPPWI